MPKLENKYEKIVWEMNMIKNIIFDIGNVILNFNIKEVLQKFTSNKIETNHCNDKLIVDFWKNYNDFVQSFYMK